MGRGGEVVERASTGFGREDRKEIRWGWETQGKESFCLFFNIAKLEHIYRLRGRKHKRRRVWKLRGEN